MFDNVSKAGTGWAVVLAGLLIEWLDLPYSDAQLASALMIVGGAIMALIGQIRREDLKWGIMRK